jgi:Cell division septal protein
MSDPAIQPIEQLARALVWGACALLAYGGARWLLAQPVFALHTVEVAAPVAHVTQAQVRLVADRYVRGNFFTVDLEQVQQAFEKLPWVREARVTRRWPDTLVVHFVEHVPLARWNDASLVNQQGEVFDAACDANLPQLEGPANTNLEVVQHYLAYRTELATVGRRIDDLQLSPRRAWRITLDGGTRLVLGRSDADAHLARFVRVYPQLFSDAQAQPLAVDLRYADGMALRYAPGVHAVAQTPS